MGLKCDMLEYFVIFDTNTLYRTYDKKGDFSVFSFNATYENIVGIINQLDIYEQVTLVIPEVVWSEMTEQIVEAHSIKLQEALNRLRRFRFPEIDVKEVEVGDYVSYIQPIIEHYKVELSSDVNKVVELPIASPDRYHSIVKRAFHKIPPFEGKEKKSDKGFKDALLWESILDFTFLHPTAKIIYYSKDNAFGDFLSSEFSQLHTEARLYICKNEVDVKQQLEEWAKEIDVYSYQPIVEYAETEHKELVEWLASENCLMQLSDYDVGILEDSRLVTDASINAVDFNNIQPYADDSGERYTVDVVLQVTYDIKGGATVDETLDVRIEVKRLSNEMFTIENVSSLDSDDCR